MMDEKFDQNAVEAEYRKFQDFVSNSQKIADLREKARSLMSPTPRELVFQEHSVSLYAYRKPDSPSCKKPLLIIPSLVNKPSIMDLLQGESFIEALIERGITVYMLEWGIPTPAQKNLGLEYYLDHYIGRAVRRCLKHADAEKLILSGYCLGGTLALLYTAMQNDPRIDRLLTMVTPVNFKDHGLLSWWAKEEHFNVDKLVDSFGNMPAEFFSSSFPWLVPTASLKKARMVYEQHKDEKFMISFSALDIWITENVPFPGQVYREIIKGAYQKNLLVEKGEWPLDHKTASLAGIKIPVFIAGAQYDHVSPVNSCLMLEKLLPNANCTTMNYPAGHLGIALGKDITNQPTTQYWDDIANWCRS
jgi:polyhydroxyalkanoate synthase